MTTTLPCQLARTRGFKLGAPRAFTIAPGGSRVIFLRSRGGEDPLTCLWSVELWSHGAGPERLVVDPAQLLPGADELLPAEELTRRERAREQAAGVTQYATDRAVRHAAFALSGRLWVTELASAHTRELPANGPVVEPRPDPTGSSVAYVSDGSVRLIGTDGAGDRALAVPEHPRASYGLPEHVAAESMDRQRGYWWAPDGTRLLVARVDTTPVQRWYVGDPANPTARPSEIAYPGAGTANADVSLLVVGTDGRRVPVRWDRTRFEYLTAASWTGREPLITVQSRDQKTMRVLSVDPESGATTLCREDTDPCWVQIVPGVPALTPRGRLIWTADLDDTRRLLVDGVPVTPAGLQVREVLGVDGETVLFTASTEPTEIGLWTYPAGDSAGRPTPVADTRGVHTGQRAGGTTVVVSHTLAGTEATVHRAGRPSVRIASHAQTPVVAPRVQLLRAGERELRTAVLFPSDHVPGTRLPVLLDPYGGPAGQRVLATRDAFVLSQWFADQGFAVVVADGRGTPGRGPAWERSIYGDRGSLALADQVSALHAVAERYPDLDLGRVAIRGWSFGGYLAALAVLRAPEVFHAAVAGAPVTDQLLYDTHWTERYLGHPAEHPERYERSSLLADAPTLRRPLLLIHGLADDNVHVAHTLRLSAALTAAGRPHTVLPLPGVTHQMPPDSIAENVLALQVDFLRRALAGSAEPIDQRVRG